MTIFRWKKRCRVNIVRFKDKVEFWSCDCIVKETVWNRSEKVDQVAYKYGCELQGSKLWPSLGKCNKHCTQEDVYGTTQHVVYKCGPHF